MHTVIAAAIAQWHSRLNACVRVNGGLLNINFEPLTFCCVLFVLSILVALNGNNFFYANDFGILL